jgi:hypothetical protein
MNDGLSLTGPGMKSAVGLGIQEVEFDLFTLSC